MLLRCKNLEPPMSQLGQTRKGSERAYSFRFTPDTDRWADIPDRQLRATLRPEHVQQNGVRKLHLFDHPQVSHRQAVRHERPTRSQTWSVVSLLPWVLQPSIKKTTLLVESVAR